jgi:hypothetical protein
VYAYRVFVTHGGLIYGPDIASQYRRADRILKGERKRRPLMSWSSTSGASARALGLDVPTSLPSPAPGRGD